MQLEELEYSKEYKVHLSGALAEFEGAEFCIAHDAGDLHMLPLHGLHLYLHLLLLRLEIKNSSSLTTTSWKLCSCIRSLPILDIFCEEGHEQGKPSVVCCL